MARKKEKPLARWLVLNTGTELYVRNKKPVLTQRAFVDLVVKAIKNNQELENPDGAYTAHILTIEHGAPELGEFSNAFMDAARRRASGDPQDVYAEDSKTLGLED